jgi:hypothetical protein
MGPYLVSVSQSSVVRRWSIEEVRPQRAIELALGNLLRGCVCIRYSTGCFFGILVLLDKLRTLLPNSCSYTKYENPTMNLEHS